MTKLANTAVPHTDDLFCGPSAIMERLRLQAARIAPHFRIALLTGEAGSGKEALALTLHRLSNNPNGAFLLRPAMEFIEDRLEAARDNLASTLYLFGVETLTLAQQDQLLARLTRTSLPGPRRTFDTRAVIERVIVGSDADLRGLVAAGRMRPEFQQRIGALELRLPPLRERIDDLEALSLSMLRAMKSDCRLGQTALATMREYAWPGNLTELRRVLDQLSLIPGVVEAHQLPPFAAYDDRQVPLRLDDVMQRHVLEVLQRCAGNKLRAAEVLGISRSTLYRMLDSLAA